MRVKVNDAEREVLNWLVAQADGHLESRRVVVDLEYLAGDDPVRWEPQLSTYYSSAYAPSTDWRVAGPIIERECIALEKDPRYSDAIWVAEIPFNGQYSGPTPLIAAMRAYVASKLGDEVDVPDELMRKQA